MESKIINIGYEFKATMWLWNSKSAFITHQNDYLSLIVESEEVSQLVKGFFDSMWNHHPEVTL